MPLRTALLSACAALALSLPALGAPGTDESQADRLRRAQAALQTAARFMQERKYVEALEQYQEADQLAPGRPAIRYDIACALARLERTDDALDALEQAVKLGFNDHEHMLADEDLAALREAERFKKCVNLAKQQTAETAPLLHVPQGYDANGDRAYPLLVLLHGAGAAPEGLFNAGRQSLGANDWFILAPYGSARAGTGYTWNSGDVARIPAAVADLRKKYRINRVYLFGFSAGGHVGYVLVLKSRSTFDGFIPMAGSIGNALRNKWVTEGDLNNAKGLPIYAIQGTKDEIVPLRAAEQSLDTMRTHGSVTKMLSHPGGHTAPADFRKALLDAVSWLNEHQPPAP